MADLKAIVQPNTDGSGDEKKEGDDGYTLQNQCSVCFPWPSDCPSLSKEIKTSPSSNQVQERSWASLSDDILSLILRIMFGKDVPVFRAVCRSWKSTPSPKSKHIQVSEIVKHPFLLGYHLYSKSATVPGKEFYSPSYSEIYSPTYNKTYSVENRALGLGSAQIHCFRYGWLLLSSSLGHIFFLQPTTFDNIFLPRENNNSFQHFNVMSFSAPPTSPKCVVMGIPDYRPPSGYSSIFFIRRGDSSWSWTNFKHGAFPNKKKKKKKMLINSCCHHHRLDARYKSSSRKWFGPKVKTNALCRHTIKSIPCNGRFEWYSYCSAPVFHKGAFYCLGQTGKLGVFDPWKKKKKKMWRLTANRGYGFLTNDDDRSEAYLMESSSGELISILVGWMGECIRVFRYNHDVELWQSLCSLGDQVAFISHTSSMILPCRELQVKGLENTIQFPRFAGGYNVFYSLRTNKFHSFKEGYTSQHDFGGTELGLNCTWIVPKFHYLPCVVVDWFYPPEEELTKGGDNDDIGTWVDPCAWACRYLKVSQQQPPPCQYEKVISSSDYYYEKKLTGRPWIILSHGRDGDGDYKKDEDYTFVDLVSGSFHSRVDDNHNMSESLSGKCMYGVAIGRIVLVDVHSGDWALLNTSSMTMDSLPTWKVPKNFVKLSCLVHFLPRKEDEDSDSQLVVIVFGIIRDPVTLDIKAMIAFCRVGDQEWTTQVEQGTPQVAGTVSYQGSIYAIGRSAHGSVQLYKMELQPEQHSVAIVKIAEFPKYEPRGSMANLRYLVESCGEILLFTQFFSWVSATREITMEVTAYRMEVTTLRWKALDDLGDRVFFFRYGLGGFGCRASTSGFPPNSIYFLSRYDRGNVTKYNYQNQTTSSVLSCKDDTDDCSLHGLVMC